MHLYFTQVIYGSNYDNNNLINHIIASNLKIKEEALQKAKDYYHSYNLNTYPAKVLKFFIIEISLTIFNIHEINTNLF